jgi:hypothetical protein
VFVLEHFFPFTRVKIDFKSRGDYSYFKELAGLAGSVWFREADLEI